MEINKILSATEVKGAYFENMVSSCEQRKEIVSRNLKHCCFVYVALLVNQLLTACLFDCTLFSSIICHNT
jgi:hypothetical protein